MSIDRMITISDLGFAYNGADHAVLEGFSLDIQAGAITAILGPNGSGKSTLLRLLLGSLSPQKGTIHIAGRPQRSYARRELSRLIGLVPQDEHIPFDFSVLDYVLMGRAPYLGPLDMPAEADRKIALDALKIVGLAVFRDRPVPTLSGGERQLATIARALVQQPHILLLDEPTAHLDLGNTARLLDILRRLADAGITLVLTTHDPNLAASVAGFAVLIGEGRVVASGAIDTVLTRERLAATYGVAVRVYEVEGRRIILLPR